MLTKIIKLFSKNSVVRTNITRKGKIIDGIIIMDEKIVNTMQSGINYTIEIHGDVKNLDTNGKVTIHGNVTGNINTRGRVIVNGNVEKNINTIGQVNVNGSVGGSIDTIGSVSTGR